LRGQGSAADHTISQEWLNFNSPAGAPGRLRMRLASFAGLQAGIVGNEALPALAGHDPILRSLLGVPGAAPGIDRRVRFIEAPGVTDDERLPLVVYPAAG